MRVTTATDHNWTCRKEAGVEEWVMNLIFSSVVRGMFKGWVGMVMASVFLLFVVIWASRKDFGKPYPLCVSNLTPEIFQHEF